MILMLDHVTISTSEATAAAVRAEFPSYTVRFEEKALRNINAKQALFHAPQASHNIIKLDANGSYPLELTVYPTTGGNTATAFSTDGTAIVYQTANVEESCLFWLAVGFRLTETCETSAVLTLKGPLDSRPTVLRLCKATDTPAFLDAEGITSLAFITNRLDRLAEGLRQAGFTASQPEKLTVHGRELTIFFAHGMHGEIAELISLS